MYVCLNKSSILFVFLALLVSQIGWGETLPTSFSDPSFPADYINIYNELIRRFNDNTVTVRTVVKYVDNFTLGLQREQVLNFFLGSF